ncbi:MAG: DUF4430 domain-containing protein [Candidatus Micrarchaeota archaeon]
MEKKLGLIPFLLLFSLFASGCTSQKITEPISVATLVPEMVALEVTIDDGNFPVSKIIEVEKGTSALAAFEKAAKLEYKKYPFGSYVYSINGKRENTYNDGRYWQYYVNGKIAMVAVDNFIITSGARLEFRYEKQNPEIR